MFDTLLKIFDDKFNLIKKQFIRVPIVYNLCFFSTSPLKPKMFKIKESFSEWCLNEDYKMSDLSLEDKWTLIQKINDHIQYTSKNKFYFIPLIEIPFIFFHGYKLSNYNNIILYSNKKNKKNCVKKIKKNKHLLNLTLNSINCEKLNECTEVNWYYSESYQINEENIKENYIHIFNTNIKDKKFNSIETKGQLIHIQKTFSENFKKINKKVKTINLYLACSIQSCFVIGKTFSKLLEDEYREANLNVYYYDKETRNYSWGISFNYNQYKLIFK